MAKQFLDHLNLLSVDQFSQVPKYEQIVQIILSDIENGIFRNGEQIPSINETSCEFYVSRDTVEKAYKILKNKGIIVSVKGKGYFVKEQTTLPPNKILILAASINEHTLKFIIKMKHHFKEQLDIQIDLQLGDNDFFIQFSKNNLNKYSRYLIFIDKNQFSKEMNQAIQSIPKSLIMTFGLHDSEQLGLHLWMSSEFETVYSDKNNCVRKSFIDERTLINYMSQQLGIINTTRKIVHYHYAS